MRIGKHLEWRGRKGCHTVTRCAGRQAWAAERLAETFEPQETPEQVEPLSNGASAKERRWREREPSAEVYVASSNGLRATVEQIDTATASKKL